MAKKVILKDLNDIEVLPITRGELVLDASGNPALHSTLFLATDSLPGLMSSEDKYKLDHLEESGPGANNKVAQINTTTDDVYRLLFSETADDTDRTEKSRKSANLTFNPSTGILNLTGGVVSGKLTITNNANLKLILDTTESANYNLIEFQKNGTSIGYIGTINDTFRIKFENYPFYYNGNNVLHSGNYNEYALPLTGGTLTQTENKTNLIIKNTTYNPYITFMKGTIVKGHIVVNESKELHYQPQGGITYEVLHLNNYSKYALPITGGSIKSNDIGLHIKRTGGNPKIAFYIDERLKGYIGYDDNENPIVHPASGSEQIIIHSGNYKDYIANMYWANVPVSSTSNDKTTPTLGGAVINGVISGVHKIQFTALGANGISYDLYGNPQLGPSSADWTLYDKDCEVILRGIPNGNVGINVSNPQARLHIAGSSTDFTAPVGLTENNATGNSWYAIHAFTNPSMAIGEYTAIQIGKKLNTKNCGHLSFYYAGDSSDNNRFALGFYNAIDLLVVKADGKVGIGTTNPSYKLHTEGKIASTSSQNTVQLISDADCGLYMTSSGQWIHIAGSGREMYIYNGTWDNKGTGNYNKGITISTTNNIGIGTTSPSEKLHVVGNNYIDGYLKFKTTKNPGSNSAEARLGTFDRSEGGFVILLGNPGNSEVWKLEFSIVDPGWTTALFKVDRGGKTTTNNLVTQNTILSENYHLVYNCGSYSKVASSVTGAIVIKLPITSSQHDMVNVEISVYEYNSRAASKIIVGGHPWNGTWYLYSCSVIGGYDRGVRLGICQGQWSIILGTSSTVWNYPGIFVTHIGTVYEDYKDSYLGKCTFVVLTSESGLSALVTPKNVVNATTANKLNSRNLGSTIGLHYYYAGGITASTNNTGGYAGPISGTVYSSVLRLQSHDTAGLLYYRDLIFDVNSDAIWSRRVTNSSSPVVQTLLHSGNYSDFLDNRYYTETEVNNLLKNYLPLAGGVMTGKITFKVYSDDSVWIGPSVTDNTSFLEFHVLDDFNDGFKWTTNLYASSGNVAYTMMLLTGSSSKVATLSLTGNMNASGTSNANSFTLNGATTAGTNYITGTAGRIFFGGNFHIDAVGSNHLYLNHYTGYNVYMCSGSSKGSVGIRTAAPSYPLHVAGDSYTTGWSRSGSGFYIENTGVHFTHLSSIGEIDMSSNNEFLWGSSNSDLYFNHRAVSRGTTVTNYIWNAGSSSSYASHTMGVSYFRGSGKYLRIGPQNDSHAHYETNANSSHWFNTTVDINGTCRPYANKTFNCGESSRRWAAFYSVSGSFSGAVTLGEKVSARKATWLKLTTPGHTGSSAWCVGIDDTTDNSYLYMKYNESDTSYFYVRHDGCAFAPHFYESSDQRLKENIQAILNKDNIPQIKEFDWKESGEHSYGLIAQELEEQGYSELVSTKDDGYKTVNYSAALSLIVGKLQVKIKELEKEIEILKNK